MRILCERMFRTDGKANVLSIEKKRTKKELSILHFLLPKEGLKIVRDKIVEIPAENVCVHKSN